MSKELILEVSLELLRIKSRRQFFSFLNGPLRKLLFYSHTTIFVQDGDVEGFANYFVNSSDELSKAVFCDRIDVAKMDDKVGSEIGIFDQTLLGVTSTYLNSTENSKGWLVEKQFLKNGSKIIGCWMLLYADSCNISEGIRNYLPQIGRLVKAAYDNVSLSEDIARREMENDIVQSLAVDIACIKDKWELLKIVHSRLRNIFDYIDHFVAVVNDDQSSVTSFLQDTRSWVDEHPSYEESVNARYPFNDGIFNRVILSKDPHAFDLDHENSKGNMPQYFQILYESGIKTVIMIGLHVRDRMIGLWCICKLEAGKINSESFRLVKNVANQLSIAVENIMANEALLKRENERKYILRLGESFRSVQTKTDLFKVISKTLRPLFPAHDIVFFILGPDGRYSPLFVFSDKFDASSPYQLALRENLLPSDLCFEQTMQSTGAVVISLENLGASDRLPNYVRIEIEKGIKEKAGIRLRTDSTDIGVLFINSSSSGTFNDHNLNLVEGISFQLSLVIDKILKVSASSIDVVPHSFIHSFNRALINCKGPTDLGRILDTNIIEFLGVDKFCWGEFNETDSVNSALQFMVIAKDSTDHFKEAMSLTLDADDPVLSRMQTSENPFLLNVQQLVAESERSLGLDFWLRNGFGDILCAVASVSTSASCIVCLNVDVTLLDSAKQALLNTVCLQLLSKVSHFVASNQLVKSVEQINYLKASREIGLAFAQVGDKNTLALIFSKELGKIIDHGGYSCWLLSSDESEYSVITPFDQSLVSDDEQRFNQKIEGDSTLSDYIRKVVSSTHPHTFNLADFADLVPNIWTLSTSSDYEDIMGVSVQIPSFGSGILWIKEKVHSRENANIDLLITLCYHLGVALGNILEKQRVLSRIDLVNSFKGLDSAESRSQRAEDFPTYPEIIGSGKEIQKTSRLIAQVSSSDSTVLLLGETGTGKELIARVIHNNSSRRAKSMVKVNCAALPLSLIESELFGHERGSFTGAVERKVGKFEQAHGSTLFLDEVGEMPLDLQVKLLRALQEKEIDRIGGKGSIKVDVRIIAATNRDLDKEMEAGKFRSDLYYRLNIFPIHIPPLRNRREDIPALANHFIDLFSKKLGKRVSGIGAKAINDLLEYDWPGNVRELEHVIERNLLMMSGNTLKEISLPPKRASIDPSGKPIHIKTIDENERDHILAILRLCDGRVAGADGAAQLLGIHPSTLNSKMKRLGIRREHFA